MNLFWSGGKIKTQFKKFWVKSQHRLVLSGYVTDSCHWFRRHETLHKAVPRISSDMSRSRFDDWGGIFKYYSTNPKGCHERGTLCYYSIRMILTYCFFLFYYINYFNLGIEDLRIKFGIRDKTRHIPVHKLWFAHGTSLCKIIFKPHVLTNWLWCDQQSWNEGCCTQKKWNWAVSGIVCWDEWAVLGIIWESITSFAEVHKFQWTEVWIFTIKLFCKFCVGVIV